MLIFFLQCCLLCSVYLGSLLGPRSGWPDPFQGFNKSQDPLSVYLWRLSALTADVTDTAVEQ